MSDQKKPAATFGDVMLGIPAGGRDKAEGSRDEKRGERKGGPMVVVKRAGGAVETRKADAPAPAGAVRRLQFRGGASDAGLKTDHRRWI